MAKPIVDLMGSQKKLDKFIKQLDQRVNSLRKHFVSEIARELKKNLGELAPRGDKDLPQDYNRSFDVVMVQSSKDPTYGVLYYGEPIKADTQDVTTTLLYVKPVSYSDDSVEGEAFRVLAKFSPYTVDMFPTDVPSDKAYVIYRKVSPREVVLIREKNNRDRPELTKRLKEQGFDVDLTPVDLSKLEIVNDLVFQVIRKELGIGASKKPHWRPAIRSVASSKFIEDLLSSKEVARTLTNMEYRGWKSLGSVPKKVVISDLEDIEEFQERITEGL